MNRKGWSSPGLIHALYSPEECVEEEFSKPRLWGILESTF
jgi:hypothetical protein